MTKLRDQMNKYEPSDTVKRLNPELYEVDKDRLAKWIQNPLPVKGIEKFKTAWSDKEPSTLEQKFISIWESIGGISPLRECKCLDSKRFRWDFCWPERKAAVEVHGLVRRAGRGAHQSHEGVSRDCKKQFLATIEGWRLISLTPDLVNEENLKKIKIFIDNLSTIN
jgi:hypothetical protein